MNSTSAYQHSNDIFPTDTSDDSVEHLSFRTKPEEEEGVAKAVRKLRVPPPRKPNNQWNPPSVAIFLRNRADIPRIARRLLQKYIPVNYHGIFFDTPEIMMLMNFLITLTSPTKCSMQLYSLIASPAYSFPPHDLALITGKLFHVMNQSRG